MKKVMGGLLAGAGISFSVAVQSVQAAPSFMMTLSNKQRLRVDCSKLEGGTQTMAFLAQFEPYTPEQIAKLTPQQQMWLKMTRESRSTDSRLLSNISSHLKTAHGINKAETDAAYGACLSLMNDPVQK